MKLVQLSDPHVRESGVLAYERVETAAYLERAVNALNQLVPRPDVVVVSGDLTDFGTPAEMRTARQLLDRLACPYVVLPGNHDDPAVMLAEFADYGLPGEVSLDLGLCWRFDLSGVQVVGLDSTVPGEAHGNLGEARLDWLDSTLSASAAVPTLIFMHHPPFATGIAHMDRQNLRDGDQLYAVLQRHSHVSHVACGHVHRAIETCIAGIPTSIAPAPAHAVALDTRPDATPQFYLEPPAVRLFYSTGAALLSHVVFLENYAGPYPFFDAEGRTLGR
jgi:3',5'-cyclic AMP phosphodiesterase CpdA